MQNVRIIKEDVYYVGVNDRRITMFENTHPIQHGMAYNSYLILDEKTVYWIRLIKRGPNNF